MLALIFNGRSILSTPKQTTNGETEGNEIKAKTQRYYLYFAITRFRVEKSFYLKVYHHF